jgi:hypothetical protein
MAAPGAADDAAMKLAAENQRLQQQLAEQAATIQAQAYTIRQQEDHMNAVALPLPACIPGALSRTMVQLPSAGSQRRGSAHWVSDVRASVVWQVVKRV